MRSRPGLVIVALAVATATVAIVVTLRITPPTPPPSLPPAPAQQGEGEQAAGKPQNLEIQGVQVTQRDKQTGKIIWQARATGGFDFDEQTQALQASDIHWELTRAGQEKIVVEAPKFVAHYKDKQINFADGVRVYTQSKSQLFEVASLVYEVNTQKLIGAGPVIFRVGKYRVTGDRLVIDNKARRVRISGRVHLQRLARS